MQNNSWSLIVILVVVVLSYRWTLPNLLFIWSLHVADTLLHGEHGNMQLYWAYWNLHNCPRSSQEDSLNTRLNTTSKRVTVGHVEAYPLLAAVFGITGTTVTINISTNYKHLMYGKFLWQHACDQKIRRCDKKIRRFDPKGSSLWQKDSYDKSFTPSRF